jgi:hypothetical protein
MTKDIAIVHFNTPELTEALIKSIRKHGGENYRIFIFDNSDTRPFKKRIKGVKVINNTKGKFVNFDEELAKFPDKQEHVRKSSNFASTKHQLSVQKLFELLPDGFVLLDSDILIKRPIDFLWNEKYAAVGAVQRHQPNYKVEINRLLPMMCYLNVPLLTKHGAKYFDPQRTFGLLPGELNRGNWYDTGAVILEDIRRTKPALVALVYQTLTNYYAHYQHGSWKQNDLENQLKWLNNNTLLWQ